MIYKFEILASLKRVVSSHQDFIDAGLAESLDFGNDITMLFLGKVALRPPEEF